jgi:hypothetical protein
MLLRKGPMDDSAVEKQGWFSRIDKPALIASLVIVNAIIILLLIVFLVRKKRKNE